MQTTIVGVGVAIAFALFFVSEGLVLGKLLQPAIFFVGYITLVTPPWPTLVLVTALSAFGATVGQWALYRTITPTRPAPGEAFLSTEILNRIPRLVRRWLGHRWVALVERQVDRFGRIGIAVCTALPGVRTVVPVVAGLGAQPERGYVVAAGVGNAVYMLLLVGAAYGVLGLSRLFVGI